MLTLFHKLPKPISYYYTYLDFRCTNKPYALEGFSLDLILATCKSMKCSVVTLPYSYYFTSTK